VIDPHNFSWDDYLEYFGSPGHCVAMALALHELTGWPIVRLWNPGARYGHAVVKSPLGYFDARGLLGREDRERWERRAPRPYLSMFKSRCRVEEDIQKELDAEEADQELPPWGLECHSPGFLDRIAKSDASLELARAFAPALVRAWFPAWERTKPAEQLVMFQPWELEADPGF